VAGYRSLDAQRRQTGWNTAANGHAGDSASLATERDDVLVMAAREDRQAFAAIYERYAERIYRYAFARTGSASVADDIVSDTMLAALEGINTFDASAGSVAGWLFSIAHHKVADRGRQLGRFRRALARFTSSAVPGLNDDVLDGVIHAEDARLVRRLLERLPAADRDLVLLRYSAGLNAAEIASVLDISHGAARMRLSRALDRMATDLDALGDE
jgi:RNA polymerase sigma-70 factor (ECF subfamily)